MELRNVNKKSALAIIVVAILSCVYIVFFRAKPTAVERNGSSTVQPNDAKSNPEKLVSANGHILKEIENLSKEIQENHVIQDSALLESRAGLYADIGSHDESYHDYTTALEILFNQNRPTRRVALLRIPVAITAGYHEEAKTDLEGIIRTENPGDDSSSLYAITALLCAKSSLKTVYDPKKSLEYAHMAFESSTNHSDVSLVQRSLAAAYASNGDYKSAVEHQRKAVSDELKTRGKASDMSLQEMKAYENNKPLMYDRPVQKLGADFKIDFHQ